MNEWILMSEKRPENAQRVIGFSKRDDGITLLAEMQFNRCRDHKDWCNHDMFYCHGSSFLAETVYAWMSLPEPPQ